jgi:hypothetical protein
MDVYWQKLLLPDASKDLNETQTIETERLPVFFKRGLKCHVDINLSQFCKIVVI